ncbi:hypothetical protein HYDPIDRAFT_99381 [Hydnomerulius pinastri MD-312]|uniref:CBF1-interacting co-repressor CIR N-terminal domain-containing protein n=1 Tax=Hydnomerulius pinastri MD-312 TaxID=994086 RepID=A0A0C9VQZ9_9AGAM|nr:hypothetical protein HYDPIDRAFT_178005 [Hydnomerulius pinastri MD-312]KIJ60165.1 hypothetical protein HYDPIDRAFT_99381 [Hydnomerulius pinastri MD-312]
MGKLNIAHHKSYHPYRRDNIERVRRDEEEAARKEAEKEGRIVLADAEARIGLLRERAGLGTSGKGKGKAKEEDDMAALNAGSAAGTGIGSGKHINFFEDLEQQSMITAVRASKKTTPLETEKGVPLAPSAKDLNPWYSDKNRDRNKTAEDEQDEQRQRDLMFKSLNDPLTAITHQLASRSLPSNPPRPSLPPINARSRNHRPSRHNDPPRPAPPQPKPLDPTTARLSRESSERERALALIRRKQREMAGSETPSTVHGGMDGGYGDVFNKREVEEAHAHRDRWKKRTW